jgi:hypothetical protein
VAVLRDYPEDLGVTAYGAPPGRPQAPAIHSTGAASRAVRALADAARTKTFWALAGGFAICGATTNGLIGTHFVPSAHDHGMPETTAAGLLALVGIFDIAGTIVSGVLTDRIDPRLLLVCYYFFRGVGLLVLPWLLSTPCGRAFFCSSSSTGWTGWPPCRPRRRCAEKRSERRERSCSAGCSPHTSSGRPSPRPRPGSSATRPASTPSPGSAGRASAWWRLSCRSRSGVVSASACSPPSPRSTGICLWVSSERGSVDRHESLIHIDRFKLNEARVPGSTTARARRRPQRAILRRRRTKMRCRRASSPPSRGWADHPVPPAAGRHFRPCSTGRR